MCVCPYLFTFNPTIISCCGNCVLSELDICMDYGNNEVTYVHFYQQHLQ